MKTGRSLQAIAAELEREVATRKDYVAPQGMIAAKVLDGNVILDGLNGAPVGIQPFAHQQFADHLGIPKRYYDRMLTSQPDLLATNLNTWLRANPDEKRMFRTLDGKARAFLSPKFRPLDNFQLANAVLPTLIAKGAQVMSAELTETRMYIKAILPSLSDVLPEGMAWGEGHHIFSREERKVVAAIVISNSEVGAGTLRVEPSVYTAYCTNLAVLTQAAMKKYHVGRAVSVEDGYEVFQDETREADDKAFWLKVRDVTVAAFADDKFAAAVAQIRNAAGQDITSAELPTVVDVTVKRLALPEATAGSILSHLARGGQLNQWGLSSAVTRAAQDVDSYELATDMERAGGEILAWAGRDWQQVATAAA